jgi:RND family efflux transporter MFP subunit
VSASGNHGALEADVDAATAELAAATAQRDRLAGLVADDAVPRRRLEDAEAEVKVARARLDAARTRLQSYNASAQGGAATTSGAFRVRAPIAGTLVDVRVTSGETVDGGALLFTVIALDRVWVTGRVFEADLPKLDDTSGAWFQVEGREEVFEIGGDSGRLVTVGSVIDPKTRTVPVVFEVGNESRALRIGQFATLTIGTGKPISAVAVPESALLQEGGQWIAYVQPEGESFVRRVVQTGASSRGWVEIRGGLSEGEHVVTTGAYDVKLAASAGSAPAHGHSH